MSKFSYFYRTILLIILSVAFFLGLKSILPDRLFPESSISDPSMLIDSMMLDMLEGNVFVEADLTDTLSTGNYLIEGDDTTKINNIPVDTNPTRDSSGVFIVEQPFLAELTLKPFKRSNFSKKLEKRKPVLFIPDEVTNIVTQRPIIDTLLDPTVSIQGYGYLQRFYAKLKQLEDGAPGRARVAYFGDSMNDGDLIVQDFRTMLQDEFGGFGVGFVSVTSVSSASRGSVFHKHSDNWHTQSFVTTTKKGPSTPFGVDGQVALARDAGAYSLAYTAGNVKNSPALYNPTLFYGHSENEQGYVNVNINKDGIKKIELTPQYSLNTLSLGATNAKSVRLNFGNIQSIPIYGLNFSSYTGVHVDNFSLRGNSGLPLVHLNTGLMNAFDRVLNYDLIVLHYGTNVLNYGSYNRYEQSMTAVINKLRYCFPNADILVISTADKASKINMQMVTDPAVMSLVRVQKRFARDTGSGFIDLYNLMGGNGSMVDWVNRQMANRDYTHFNIKGSKEIGTLLFDEVQRGYKKYKIQLEKEIKRSEREN